MYLLLDTYGVDKVFDDVDATLRQIAMVKTNNPTTFAARLTKSSLRFGVVYTKSQLVPIFVGGLPENLRGVVRQNLPDTLDIVYEKLERHAEVLKKEKLGSNLVDIDHAVCFPGLNAEVDIASTKRCSYDDFGTRGNGLRDPVPGGVDYPVP